MDGKKCASRRAAIVISMFALIALCGTAVIFYFVGLNNSKCRAQDNHQVTNSPQTALPDKFVEDGRLPRHIKPLLYKIKLFPNIYGEDRSKFTFNGTMWLKFQCTERSNNITLNSNKLDLNDMQVGSVTSQDEYGDPITIIRFELVKKWQFLVIHLGEYLTTGKEYYVNIDFTGPLQTDFAGLYLSTFPYRTTNQYVAATQFSPTDARKAFPCLDEPDRKAQFEISLKRRKDMISLSNMPIASTISSGTEFVTDIFERTPKMPTYLLAMAVGHLDSSTKQARQGLNYTSWAGKETINKTEHGLQFGASVLSFFENYFGITFPLPKQDILAVPETSVGAMENWGLIIFNQDRIFYQEGEYSYNSLMQSAITISHELAHQWFGNLVSMAWWSDLFLKEGFATYFSDVGIAHIHPDWNFMDSYAMRNMHSVFYADALVSSHPVYKKLADVTEIRQVFDSISYIKGGCMIRMLNFILGDSDFQLGLKRYLQQFKYDSVGHNQLWEAVEPQPLTYFHPPGVKEVMDTWILQKNYPVITINQVKPGVLKIIQERFLNNPVETGNDTDVSPFNYIWKIPLTYTTSEHASFSVTHKDILWMEEKKLLLVDRQLLDLSKPNNWIIANVKQWGYYRVNYDATNWNNLIHQLSHNHSYIDLVNRAQIINDLFSLSKADRVPLNTSLSVLNYLRFESEYVPWLAAIKEIKYLHGRLLYSAILEQFQKVMIYILNTIFANLQLNKDTLTMEQNWLRASVYDLACKFEMTACIKGSERDFEAWKNQSRKLDPDIRSTILCSALKEGTEADWNYVLLKYNTTLNTNEKYAYLSALACTKSEVMQGKLLELTEDRSTIQTRDIGFTLTSLASNPSATEKVWNHVKQNWHKFLDTFAGSLFILSSLVEGVTRPFTTAEQLRELEDFIAVTSNLGPAAQSFRQAVESTKSNVDWLAKHHETLEQWVSEAANTFHV